MTGGGTVRGRPAFAWGYLACFCVTGLVYTLLDPHAQATLIAWASTDVANLEHEPIVPLVLSAFLAPSNFVIWPVLIAPVLFGANRALGTARTALVCAAGHVIGTVVSEGIVAYRPWEAPRYLRDTELVYRYSYVNFPGINANQLDLTTFATPIDVPVTSAVGPDM